MTPSSNTMVLHTQPGVHRMSVDKIVIIADDLTGACDSGVAFLTCGRPVRVLLDESSFDVKALCQSEARGKQEVWAFTTETRDLVPEQASERVANRVTALEPILEGTLLFKKIDSAARGNFGVEISAVLRCSGAALALVAPAFPEAGRTVESGVLTVRDWSGQDAAIPLRGQFPHEDANGVEVLPAGSEQHLEQGIVRAVTKGTRVLLCDSTSQNDLERLAAAGLQVQQPLVWAGSAGLAHALAGKLATSIPKAASQTTQRHGRTLLFVGTPHAVTSFQVAHLQRESGGMDRAIYRIPCAAASEQDVVAAFTAGPVSALILTGGDTASFVLHALGASSIMLAGEIARGIPWGFVEGGMADGCAVITKSGGFGEREALVHAFEFCERRSSEPA